MSIKYAKGFVALIGGMLLVTLFIAKQFWLKESHQTSQRILSETSLVISQLNLSLASLSSSIKERQGLSKFLEKLDVNESILYWRLKDANGKLLTSKVGKETTLDTPATRISLNYYIPTKNNELLTLEVNLAEQRLQASSFGMTEILLLAGFIGLFVIASLVFFAWIFDLDKLAIELVEQPDKTPVINERIRHISIGRAIDTLIKSNTNLKQIKKELTEQIRKTTYVDEDTELGNKAFFQAEFQVRLHHHDEPESGLLILFSFVQSDTEDQLLMTVDRSKEIAHILRLFAAEYSESLVVRLGQCDFAMLLPNQTRNNVDQLCRKIILQLQQFVFDKTGVREHFVDIGISAYKQGFDYYKVMSEADMALRNAQLQGGNSWFMFGEALPNWKVKGFMKWRSYLQRVLDKRSLHLYGQPIIYFDDFSSHHQEIFVRIEDGEDTLTAEMFLPMASQCGLASEFDRQVVDGIIKHCLHEGENIKGCSFSVNLFVNSLLDDHFVGWLIGKLSSYPELSRHLIFEVRENHIIQYREQLRPIMNQLLSLGIRWSVDRFGAPDSNIDYLEVLPVSMVKIDRRLVGGISHRSRQQLLLKSLLINLRSHSIVAFADGVENQEDADYLRTTGIRGAQGYYFAKPKRLDNVERFLKAI